VKAGERTVTLIEKIVALGEATEPVIRLLPDLHTPSARELLEKIALEHSGEQADLARGCLEQLQRMDAASSDGE